MSRFLSGWLNGLLLIIVVEAVAIGGLTWAFMIRLSGQSLSGLEHRLLTVAIILTVLSFATLASYILLYHVLSKFVQRLRPSQDEQWVTLWSMVLMHGAAPPPPPLPPASVEALVTLRQLLKGELGERLQEFAVSYGLKERWLKQLENRRLLLRREALEILSVMRFPENVLPILKQLENPKSQKLWPLAAMAAARNLGIIPAGKLQGDLIQHFASALLGAELPLGVLEETLALAEDATAPLLIHLLDRQDLRLTVLRAALSVGGWRRLGDVAPLIVRYINHPDPHVRATVLRALSQLGQLSPDIERQMRYYSGVTSLYYQYDTAEVVRIQSIRVMALLPTDQTHPLLWSALADPSWWVRQAAGMALIRQGPQGLHLLERASQSHPDALAAQIATQFLLNQPSLEKPQADEWIWART